MPASYTHYTGWSIGTKFQVKVKKAKLYQLLTVYENSSYVNSLMNGTYLNNVQWPNKELRARVFIDESELHRQCGAWLVYPKRVRCLACWSDLVNYPIVQSSLYAVKFHYVPNNRNMIQHIIASIVKTQIDWLIKHLSKIIVNVKR